jgi:hypothetical protein
MRNAGPWSGDAWLASVPPHRPPSPFPSNQQSKIVNHQSSIRRVSPQDAACWSGHTSPCFPILLAAAAAPAVREQALGFELAVIPPPPLTPTGNRCTLKPMKVQPPSRKLAAINETLSKPPIKPLPKEKVRAQVIQHLSEAKSERFAENYGRFTEDDRTWDIAFWQKQGPAAIFDAMWGMIKDHRLLTKNDATEPRLQRTVEYFGKA